ncbi:MAG: Ca-activated chloride channel family protein [Cryomorphaceae bacterium]|jgi:Ca-activated chloride channel family protein
MIDLLQFSSFHFLRPWWLVLLLPTIAAAMLALRKSQDRLRWEGVIADHLILALTVKQDGQHWVNPINVGLFTLVLCVFLMAGPSWERQSSPFVQDQSVLVIALDLSNTMNQIDVQPSRLERAKQKISDLLELRGNAKTGLIAYAGSAHQIIPLSNDPDIIRQFLAAVDTKMMPAKGKFPEKVIGLVNQMLSDAPVPGTLLLIGDGISPKTGNEFGNYFDNVDYQLLVLGMGLTELDTDRQLDQKFGGAHLPLQRNALKTLAEVANGYYQENTVDKTDVQRINRLIDYHLSAVEDSDRPWLDSGYYLLFPLGLVFLLWFRRGWTLNFCLVVFLMQAPGFSSPTYAQSSEFSNSSASQLTATAQQRIADGFLRLWLTPDQLGRYYFERGKYAQAAISFVDLEWQGMSYYHAENFAAAAELLRQIDSPQGRFNLANALAQGQNYVMSARVYSEVLREDPNHSAAFNNLEFIQELIDDINRMSESQQAEPGKASRELGDAPQRGGGAEQDDIAESDKQQFTAEQLLMDKQIHEMWMRQVQADPSRFLAAKFQLQFQRQALTLPNAKDSDVN